MKQHFLPEFYLKGFCDHKASSKGGNTVWVRRRGRDAWESWAPRRLAVTDDLYTGIDAEGNRNEETERYFQTIESKMGHILKKRIRRKQGLDPDTQAWVSVFTAAQVVRVPYTHTGFGEKLEEYVEGLMNKWHKDPEAWEAIKRKHRESYEAKMGEPPPPDLGPPDPSDYEIEAGEKAKVALPLLELPRIARELHFLMQWSILTTSPDCPFITSDVPVCMMPKADEEHYVGKYVHPDLEVTFALLPTAALFLAMRTGRPLYDRASSPEVEEVNRRVLLTADEFIVASQREFPGDHLLRSWSSMPPRADISAADSPLWACKLLARSTGEHQ